MLGRLIAQLHEVRLNLRGGWLRHRERSALRRLGEDVARRGPGGSEAHAGLMAEIAEGEHRSAALAAERRGSMEVDRADLRTVAAWVGPAVVLRGLCTRLVLRHRESIERRALLPRFEAVGVLAMAAAEPGGRTGTQSRLEREVAALREALAATVAERDRRGAAFDGRALPTWTGRAGAEAAGFGRGSRTPTPIRTSVRYFDRWASEAAGPAW